jgi:hypothetical protein
MESSRRVLASMEPGSIPRALKDSTRNILLYKHCTSYLDRSLVLNSNTVSSYILSNRNLARVILPSPANITSYQQCPCLTQPTCTKPTPGFRTQRYTYVTQTTARSSKTHHATYKQSVVNADVLLSIVIVVKQMCKDVLESGFDAWWGEVLEAAKPCTESARYNRVINASQRSLPLQVPIQYMLIMCLHCLWSLLGTAALYIHEDTIYTRIWIPGGG